MAAGAFAGCEIVCAKPWLQPAIRSNGLRRRPGVSHGQGDAGNHGVEHPLSGRRLEYTGLLAMAAELDWLSEARFNESLELPCIGRAVRGAELDSVANA